MVNEVFIAEEIKIRETLSTTQQESESLKTTVIEREEQVKELQEQVSSLETGLEQSKATQLADKATRQFWGYWVIGPLVGIVITVAVVGAILRLFASLPHWQIGGLVGALLTFPWMEFVLR